VNNELQPGQKVRFKLRDVHLPTIEDVLNRMTSETELQGSITLLSNKGPKKDSYAVVEVKGVLTPVIVPTTRPTVRPVDDDGPKSW
jgi:hypothetical protein